MAPDARPHRGQAGVGRLVRREVTVQAIHAELLHVDRVRKVDRLNGRTVLRRGGAAVGGEHDGAGGQDDESRNGGPLPSLSHRDGLSCRERARACELIHKARPRSGREIPDAATGNHTARDAKAPCPFSHRALPIGALRRSSSGRRSRFARGACVSRSGHCEPNTNRSAPTCGKAWRDDPRADPRSTRCPTTRALLGGVRPQCTSSIISRPAAVTTRRTDHRARQRADRRRAESPADVEWMALPQVLEAHREHERQRPARPRAIAKSSKRRVVRSEPPLHRIGAHCAAAADRASRSAASHPGQSGRTPGTA